MPCVGNNEHGCELTKKKKNRRKLEKKVYYIHCGVAAADELLKGLCHWGEGSVYSIWGAGYIVQLHGPFPNPA